jgi:mannose-6-phosphate isomerase-like protein (cupin superfamily)
MEARRVRYEDLRPCTTAFVDTRTPGSDRKENFTIIGPGVAENPDQFVHITIPHGFNIGGARQPPRCVNSQHSHETAEVFVVHTGSWRFKTGVDGTDGHVDLGPGDVISIPTHAFRGFENVGEDVGFLFAVLGGDDPGRVTWAPYVFDSATRYGLVLLQDGRLIDTTKQSVPADAVLMRPTSAAEAASFDRYDSVGIARCTVRAHDFRSGGGLSEFDGFAECPIVGVESPAEGSPAGPLSWAHGFQVRALAARAGAESPAHLRREEEVLFVHRGALTVEWADGSLTLAVGDTLSVPKDLVRAFRNETDSESLVFVVRGGDRPAAARVVSDLRAAD